MKSFGVIAAILAAGQAGTDQRTRFEQGQADQRYHEIKSLIISGLPPLSSNSGVEVRQLALSDPYGILPQPALHIERTQAGTVTLSIIQPGRRTRRITLPSTAWRGLQDKEQGVFVQRAYTPWKEFGPDNPAPPPPPICHGWGAIVGSGGASGPRTTIWGACGSTGPSPKLDYVLEMMAIALGTQPDCVHDGDLFWAMNDCFVETVKETGPADALSPSPGA